MFSSICSRLLFFAGTSTGNGADDYITLDAVSHLPMAGSNFRRIIRCSIASFCVSKAENDTLTPAFSFYHLQLNSINISEHFPNLNHSISFELSIENKSSWTLMMSPTLQKYWKWRHYDVLKFFRVTQIHYYYQFYNIILFVLVIITLIISEVKIFCEKSMRYLGGKLWKYKSVNWSWFFIVAADHTGTNWLK